MNIELSPRQSATVAVAITALSSGVILLVVFGLFLLFARFVAVFSSVFLPKVMGERTGLHPLMIIVALFFWGTAFDGIAGMILAIPDRISRSILEVSESQIHHRNRLTPWPRALA